MEKNSPAKEKVRIRMNPGTWKYFKDITDNKQAWGALHHPARKTEKCPGGKLL